MKKLKDMWKNSPPMGRVVIVLLAVTAAALVIGSVMEAFG